MTRHIPQRTAPAFAAVLLALAMPAAGTVSAASATAAAADSSAPDMDELRNARYHGVAEAESTFGLGGGAWEGKPAVKGGASRPGVTLVRDFRLTGDLDGDGRGEAVVLLAAHTGGTGEMIYVAVMARDGAALKNLATAPVGDRVQLRGGRIDERRIVLDLVQAGADDAACCPGDLATRTWELRADSLAEGAPSMTGRLSIEALAGPGWILRGWTAGEPAPASPAVTLQLEGSRITGSAGCNRYFTEVRPGASPGEFTVGPIGATRMMCPDAEASVEARFLQLLAGVRRIQFVAGRLGLAYAAEDGHHGVMLFAPR